MFGLALLVAILIDLNKLLLKYAFRLYIIIYRLTKTIMPTKETVIRHIISILMTFFGVGIGYIVISIDNFTTWADVSWEAILLGATFAGFREVLKIIKELLVD